MRSDRETEYRWASANSRSNESGAGKPTTTIPRQGKAEVVTMYVENNMGSILHESRHGGDIARGTLNGRTYGVRE